MYGFEGLVKTEISKALLLEGFGESSECNGANVYMENDLFIELVTGD